MYTLDGEATNRLSSLSDDTNLCTSCFKLIICTRHLFYLFLLHVYGVSVIACLAIGTGTQAKVMCPVRAY